MRRRFLFIGLAFAGVIALSTTAFAAAKTASAQARVTLDRTLPQINFTNVTLREAIEFIRDVSGVNLHVNWRAIEAAGVAPDTQINVKMRNVTVRKVLGLILSEASGGVGLSFYVDDGVVEVTTKELSDSVMYTVVYPVQDLLYEAPELENIPNFGGLMGANGNNGGGGGYGNSGGGGRRGGGRNGGGGNWGGGGGGNWGGGGGMGMGGMGMGGGMGGGANKEKKDKGEELVNLIVETVSPNIWVQNGGKATIKIFSGNLVVTAPRSVHEQIGGAIE